MFRLIRPVTDEHLYIVSLTRLIRAELPALLLPLCQPMTMRQVHEQCCRHPFWSPLCTAPLYRKASTHVGPCLTIRNKHATCANDLELRVALLRKQGQTTSQLHHSAAQPQTCSRCVQLPNHWCLVAVSPQGVATL